MKKFFKEKKLAFLCLTGILFLLTGCTKNNEEIVEITFIHGWGTAENDHEAMRRIYMEFERDHPEIHLNMISMPSAEDVVNKTNDLLTVGEIPDIIFTAGDGRESVYQYMVNNDYALDLIPYMKEDSAFSQNVSPLIIDYWKTDSGKLFTISDVCLMVGYWYNCDLFAQANITEPPKTWYDWEEACAKLKQQTPQNAPLILDADHIVYLTNVIIHENDFSHTDSKLAETMDVHSPEFQRAVKLLEKTSVYADTINAYSYRDTLEAFNQGKTAIYINGVWANDMIDETLNVAYAAFPSESGSNISMISSGVGYILGNTGNEKRINASIEFLKYMLSEPVAQKLLTQTSQVPSNPNLVLTEESASERLHQAVSCVKNATSIIESPGNTWSNKLQNSFGETMILYLENLISYEELLHRLSDI